MKSFIYTLIQKLRLSQGARSSVIVSSGNVVGSGLSAVAMILLSRGLGPEQFGLFSALFSVLLITSRASDIGINLATHRKVAQTRDDPQTVWIFLSQACTIKTSLSVVVLGLGWYFAPTIADVWIRTERVDLVRMVIAFSLINTGYEFFLAVSGGFHRFTQVALATIGQGLVKFGFTLGLLSMSLLTTTGAIYLYSLAPLVFIFGIVPIIGKVQVNYIFSIRRFDLVLQPLKWTSIGVISATIAENIDVLLIQRYLTSYETGIFAASSKIALFVSLLGTSVIAVMSIRVAKYRDMKNLHKFLRKAHWVAGLSLLGALCLIPFSSFIISNSLGEAYRQSQIPLMLLLLSVSFKIVSGVYATLFYLFDRPEYYAISGVILTVTLLVLEIALIPTMGIFGAGIARISSQFVVLVFTIFYAWRSYVAFISEI